MAANSDSPRRSSTGNPANPNAAHRFAALRWLIAAAVLLAAASPSTADEFNRQATLYRQLLAPMQSVIDGKPFRDAIDRVAQQARLNVCIDRRVDPTALVHPGALGPNVYAAIKKIAAERDCVIMPVAGVLLVGRPGWVEATADVLIQLTPSSGRQSVNVNWDDLTTPNEALKFVAADTRVAAKLPHDLWPKTSWRAIDQNVALALVLAQFDRRLKPGSATASSIVEFAAAESAGSCLRRYRAGKHNAIVRQAISQHDSASQVRVERDVLKVQATAAAHRMATTALLDRLTTEAPAKPTDDAVFDVEAAQRAGDALLTFANRSGRKCKIDPDAMEACTKIVTLKAKQKTLRELAEMVAGDAGLVIRWTDKEVIVSKAK